MLLQYDFLRELVTDRARGYLETAAAIRRREKRGRVRRAAAAGFRHLADRLDGSPAALAVPGR